MSNEQKDLNAAAAPAEDLRNSEFPPAETAIPQTPKLERIVDVPVEETSAESASSSESDFEETDNDSDSDESSDTDSDDTPETDSDAPETTSVIAEASSDAPTSSTEIPAISSDPSVQSSSQPNVPVSVPSQQQPRHQGQPQQGQGQPQQGQPGEGGHKRRRRRRGRGGRGGGQGQPNQPGQAGQPGQAAPQGGAPAAGENGQAAPSEKREGQPQQGQQQGQRRDGRDGNRDGGRGGRGDRQRGDQKQRGDQRRDGRTEQKPRGEQQKREEHRDDRRGEHPRADTGPGGEDRRRERQERTSERARGEHLHHRAEKSRKPIKREVLANHSFEETRVAILEDGRLAELLWERKSEESIVGNIYKGVVENVLPGISSAFVNIGFEKNAYLYISDVLGERGAAIDSTLKKGQHIMVQVAKEAIGTKGMKVTMDVSLPGRFLVFTPYQSYVGISKHIEDPAERKRLGEVVDRLVTDVLGGKGIVVRTEAEGASAEDLEREVKYLWATWTSIQKKMDAKESPALLHKDLDVTLQVARDILSEEVYVYLIDNKDAHKRIVEFVDGISPELKDRVRYYDARTPIFKAFNLEAEIEGLRRVKVPLPNGGSIVIQEAESLCAIDVNTGRFTGSKSQEETVTVTNIEAAIEVAHQLRLRNIGGIIVVDFIDMRKASNRNKVMEAFAQAVKTDRAKIRILPITRLGLIEMTRERKRESTVSLITDECPECKGAGRVLSAETIRIRIQREIFELTGGRPGGQVRILLHPGLAEVFRQQQALLEKNVQRSVKIQGDPALKWEDYRIVLE